MLRAQQRHDGIFEIFSSVLRQLQAFQHPYQVPNPFPRCRLGYLSITAGKPSYAR